MQLLEFPCEVRRSAGITEAVDHVLAGRPPDDAKSVAVAFVLQGPAVGSSWLKVLAQTEPLLALEGLAWATSLSFTYRPEYKVVLVQEEVGPSRELFDASLADLFDAVKRALVQSGQRATLSAELRERLQNVVELKAGLATVFPDQVEWTDDDSLVAVDRFHPRWLALAQRAALMKRPELLERGPTDADPVSEATKRLWGVPEAVARHENAERFREQVKYATAFVERFPLGDLTLSKDPGVMQVLREAQQARRWGPATPFLDALLATLGERRPLPLAPWDGLFSKKAPARAKAPAPPVFTLGGTWEKANSGYPVDVSELPELRETTRRSPTALAGLEDIDDLGLAQSWAAACARPANGRGPDVHGWLRRFPRLAAAGAVLVLFDDDAVAARGARIALDVIERGFPSDFQAVRASLSAEQAEWLAARRVPPPLGKAPKLPEWLELSVLPPVLTRDGTQQLSDDARRELLQAFKVTPLAEAASLLPLQQRLDLPSLRLFVAMATYQWLWAGGASKERWVVDAMAFFGDDTWAAALGEVAWRLTPDKYPVTPLIINTLSFLPARQALVALFRLSKNRTASVRKAATAAIAQSAALLGYGPEALADQLVSDTAPEGWRFGAKPGSKVPAAEKAAWKAADKEAKEALRRLERLMVERRTLPVQHYIETWGLKPLLKPLADQVVWGVFIDARRVGLFCGAKHEGTVDLKEGLGVRPINLDELSTDERRTVEGWVNAKGQPIAQLARPHYGLDSLGQLEAFAGRPFSRRMLDAFVTLGWSVLRLERIDGVYREGPGWRVELRLDPPIIPFGDGGDPPQVEAVTVQGAERMPPALLSELLHQLHTLVRSP